MTFFKKPRKLKHENEILEDEDISYKLTSNLEKSKQSNELKIDELLMKVKEPFSSTEDLVTHWIDFPSGNGKAVILFINSIVDKNIIQQQILNPLYEMDNVLSIDSLKKEAHFEFQEHTDFKLSEELLLTANTLLITEDSDLFYSILTPVKTARDIMEPDNEKVIRGSHEGFIENLNVNLALIRKNLKSSKLVVKYFKKGNIASIDIAMVYMENIADPNCVKEVERRINSIEADNIILSGNIEESIEDSPFSPFPQMLSTERPDRAGANLMEGRIAIVYDNSPTVQIVPVNFFVFYQSPDDYNTRWALASSFRFIRLISFLIAISLPAIYIAVVSFHYEVIPSGLIIPIKSSLENIPYPPLLEAMLMELTIELIREAAVRLPTRIGSTIAIVGGLVIGDAIVKAGLVSNMMIIVVAITAIAAYIVPSNEMSATVRFMRFPLMFAAATIGFLGIVFGFIILFFHLCGLYSFGSPYFAPIAPLRVENLRDTFIRLPFWKLNRRPKDVRPLKEKQEFNSRKWEENE
jgi:spore germination protein KA